MIAIPTDRPVVESDIATSWVDDDGFLVSRSKIATRTVANITANSELIQQLTGHKKVPLLIYLAKSPIPDKATRAFSTEQLPRVYTAMAMIAEPGLAQLIMRLLFALRPPPIPIRQFTNEHDARAWLRQLR